MVDLVRFAAELQIFFLDRGWRFCFIGGLALQAWGEPRVTRDVDVSLFTGFGKEEEFIKELLSHFTSRIQNGRDFAMANRVLLLSSERKIPVDVALAAFPFEELIVSNAVAIEFLENVPLNICTADDLVILKAFASRPKDWMDIEGIILRQRNALKWDYILEQLKPLCELKEDPEILPRLLVLRPVSGR